MCKLPLIRAIKTSDLDLAKLLIEHGADLEKKNVILEADEPYNAYEIQMQPIHHAILANQRDMTALFIASGADIESVNDAHRTPLMTACFGGGAGPIITEMLIKAGAQKNLLYLHKTITVNGETFMSPMTPLQMAILWSNIWIVQKLLEHNAIFEITEPNQQSVYWWAAGPRVEKRMIRKLLRQHEVNREKCVAFAMCSHPNRIRMDVGPPELEPEIFQMIFKMAIDVTMPVLNEHDL